MLTISRRSTPGNGNGQTTGNGAHHASEKQLTYPARTEAHFRRLFAVLREYLDALDAGRFNYRPGYGCGMCDFREQCSRWAG